MDNFLQLVPMEADADSDSALVYGEEDDLVVHDSETHEVLDESTAATTAAQFFDPLNHFTPAPVSAGDEISGHDSSEATCPALERTAFLQKLLSMEKLMLAAQTDVDRRLEAVRRVRALHDPTEQFIEYLPLLVEQSREPERSVGTERERNADDNGENQSRSDAGDEDEGARLTAELLECAHQMSDARDAEVALLAAFVFACDAPRSPHSQRRNPNSIVPAIAALLEESTDGLEVNHHHPQHQHHSF